MTSYDPSQNRNNLSSSPEEDRWRVVTVSRAAFLVRRVVDSMPGNKSRVAANGPGRISITSEVLPNEVGVDKKLATSGIINGLSNQLTNEEAVEMQTVNSKVVVEEASNEDDETAREMRNELEAARSKLEDVWSN